MSERTKVEAKTTEAKKDNSVSQKRKTEQSQPMRSPADHILFLQRTIGNQAVQGLIRSGALQAKLNISMPGDRYEQEADRVAERVVASKPPQALHEGKAQVQRKSLSDAPVADNFVQNLGPGQPLDTDTRAFFEPRFGYDFSGVRVHTDGRAAESARAVKARAYTVGRDVVFGEGRYCPKAEAGRRLIAHELAHTVQQGRIFGPHADLLGMSHTGDSSELEADLAARQVISGGLITKLSHTGPALHRGGIDDNKPSDKPRESGLTEVEWAKIKKLRRFFKLPEKPTKSLPTLVGILITPDGEEIPLKSGEEGGPWAGTQRGGIPRGKGEGFTSGGQHQGNIATHVEGHAAAAMHVRKISEATLLIEEQPCEGTCDLTRNWDPVAGDWSSKPKRTPGVPTICTVLPPGSKLKIVDPETTTPYKSSQLPSQTAPEAPILGVPKLVPTALPKAPASSAKGEPVSKSASGQIHETGSPSTKAEPPPLASKAPAPPDTPNAAAPSKSPLPAKPTPVPATEATLKVAEAEPAIPKFTERASKPATAQPTEVPAAQPEPVNMDYFPKNYKPPAVEKMEKAGHAKAEGAAVLIAEIAAALQKEAVVRQSRLAGSLRTFQWWVQRGIQPPAKGVTDRWGRKDEYSTEIHDIYSRLHERNLAGIVISPLEPQQYEAFAAWAKANIHTFEDFYRHFYKNEDAGVKWDGSKFVLITWKWSDLPPANVYKEIVPDDRINAIMEPIMDQIQIKTKKEIEERGNNRRPISKNERARIIGTRRFKKGTGFLFNPNTEVMVMKPWDWTFEPVFHELTGVQVPQEFVLVSGADYETEAVIYDVRAHYDNYGQSKDTIGSNRFDEGLPFTGWDSINIPVVLVLKDKLTEPGK